jgi:riboflavin biosynthesis pyrimidine reductase
MATTKTAFLLAMVCACSDSPQITVGTTADELSGDLSVVRRVLDSGGRTELVRFGHQTDEPTFFIAIKRSALAERRKELLEKHSKHISFGPSGLRRAITDFAEDAS